MSDPVPDLLLERYRLGEVSEEEHRRLECLLAEDPESRERLRRLEESDVVIRRRHPPEWLAEQVRARLEARAAIRKRTRAARPWPQLAVLAAAVVLAVVHLSRPPRSPAPPAAGGAAATTPAGDRVKGLRPSLALYRRTSQGSEPLEDGARARAGDVVRLGYRAVGHGYGTLFSIDGRGLITRHLPRTGTLAVPLKTGETVLLDQAYELDDAPCFERFYLVASEAPFDVEMVLGAARREASGVETSPALALPEGYEQSTLSLEKEETR
jgi:hypothetical protein